MMEIFSNDIPLKDQRDKISEAVQRAVGDRPGDWEAEIHSSSWVVTLTGPNEFHWEHEFFGPEEQDPEFVKKTVEEALSSTLTISGRG